MGRIDWNATQLDERKALIDQKLHLVKWLNNSGKIRAKGDAGHSHGTNILDILNDNPNAIPQFDELASRFINNLTEYGQKNTKPDEEIISDIEQFVFSLKHEIDPDKLSPITFVCATIRDLFVSYGIGLMTPITDQRNKIQKPLPKTALAWSHFSKLTSRYIMDAKIG